MLGWLGVLSQAGRSLSMEWGLYRCMRRIHHHLVLVEKPPEGSRPLTEVFYCLRFKGHVGRRIGQYPIPDSSFSGEPPIYPLRPSLTWHRRWREVGLAASIGPWLTALRPHHPYCPPATASAGRSAGEAEYDGRQHQGKGFPHAAARPWRRAGSGGSTEPLGGPLIPAIKSVDARQNPEHPL